MAQRTVERLSYFSFYVADYLLDTGDLTLAQHGAYCLLIFRYYWQGAVKEADIYRSCKDDADRAAVDFVIARYFTKEGDRFVHNRIERELQSISAYVELQAIKGRRSAELRAGRKAQQQINGHKHPAVEDSGETIERIPLNTGEEFEIKDSYAKELKRLYPNVDVPQTLREIRGWCIANPRKCKTLSGVRRFINTWMTKEQNHG